MTEKELYKKRTVCVFCRKKFRLLGSHVVARHEMTAAEYKEEVGLNHNVPLTDDAIREKHQADAQRNIELITAVLATTGAKTRISKGQKIVARYKSPDRINQIGRIHSMRHPVLKKCVACGKEAKVFRWRKYCDQCLPIIHKASNDKLRERGYFRDRIRALSKNPEWRRIQTEKHRIWVEKNREHLREYRRRRKERLKLQTAA